MCPQNCWKPPKLGWCGSDGSGWVPDGNWGEACKKHDACYGSPGANKEQCDLSLMIDITKECSKWGAQSNQCATVGAVYGFGLLVEGIWNPFSFSRDAFKMLKNLNLE